MFLLVVSSAAVEKNSTFQILSHLFLIHNLFQDTAFSINGVTWSPGVEVEFYFLAFAVVPFAARAKRGTLLVSYVLLLSSVLAYRLLAWVWLRNVGAPEAEISHLLSQAPALVESFAAGGLIYFVGVPQLSRAQTIGLKLLAGALLVVIFLIYDANAARYWTLLPTAVLFRTLIAVFVSIMLLLALSLDASPIWRPLLKLGELSYGIYLWHLIVLFLVQRELKIGGAIAVIIIVTTTIILAELSHRYVETPCMRWAHNARLARIALNR